MINGLIPHFVENGTMTGSVSVSGMDVKDAEMYELSKHVGSVFQNPKSQFFHTDAESEIVFGLENAGTPVDVMQERLDRTVRNLHIEKLIGRDIFSMSGGEKQILAFASVYAMNTDIFVLDEPTANLDEKAIQLLHDLLLKSKDEGHTIIIAEHRLYFLMDLVDRAVWIKNGEIVREFTGDEFAAITEDERINMGLRTLVTPKLSVREDTYKGNKSKEDGLLVSNLTCRYGKQEIFHDVSFYAERGKILGITGQNGVGKSTLARTLCGLFKEKNGQVHLDGRNLSAKERNRQFFLVMQDVNHQLFSDSVWGELELSAREISEDYADQVLRTLDLLEYQDKHPMALSGGQKQRLAVATAILSEKDVLVFDEPTSGLDYRRMQRMGEMMQELKKQNRVVIVVTHDYEFLNEICDNVFVMKESSNEGN